MSFCFWLLLSCHELQGSRQPLRGKLLQVLVEEFQPTQLNLWNVLDFQTSPRLHLVVTQSQEMFDPEHVEHPSDFYDAHGPWKI